MRTLTLAEQLLLLATHDMKGSVIMAGSTAIPYGLAGAIVMELHLQKRVQWHEKKLVIADRSSTGWPIIDEALEIIAASEKDRDAKYWVSRLNRKIPKLKNRLYEGLADRGILKKEEKKFLWVFPYSRYPEHDPQPERRVRDMLQDLLDGRITPTERLLSLLSLVRACDLIAEVFGKEKKREMKKRIDDFLEDDRVGKAVSAVVAEVNAAVMIAVTASIAASSSASSG